MRRDRLTFGMIIGLPVMQLLLFGYAINQDVRHLRAAVADLSGSQRARLLVRDARASQVVDVVEHARSAEELEALLREGAISVGSSCRLISSAAPRAATGRRRNYSWTVATRSYSPRRAASRSCRCPAAPARERARPTSFEVRAYYNPERRSPVQIVPGLMGVILTMTMVLFTAVAIVRERERGNLELLINTPIRTPELMLGKILPYMAIGIVQLTLILLARARALRRADPRRPRRRLRRERRLHRRRALAGPVHLDAGRHPVPGLPADVLHASCRRSCSRASCSRSTACRAPRAGSPRSSR